ncbi:MAG: hypothetical protein WCE20_06495 [Rhizomicrobium sp.]
MGDQGWQFFGLDQEFDASRDARLALYQPYSFEGQHHLMDGRRTDAEMALQVGFGWRASENAGIGVDEGEVLALLGSEDRDRGVHVT